MTAAHPVVRRATDPDADAITEILSRGFHADPPLVWILPDPGERPRLSPAFFRPFVEMVLADGTAYITEDRTAAALWLDVDVNVAPEDDGGAFRKLFTEGLGSANAERFFVLDDLFTANHPGHESHAYLLFVGVRPDRRNAGVGSGVLTAHLAKLDQAGQSAYLEASSPENERLYRRLGFAPFGLPVTLPGGPTLVPMWRAPGGTDTATTEAQ